MKDSGSTSTGSSVKKKVFIVAAIVVVLAVVAGGVVFAVQKDRTRKHEQAVDAMARVVGVAAGTVALADNVVGEVGELGIDTSAVSQARTPVADGVAAVRWVTPQQGELGDVASAQSIGDVYAPGDVGVVKVGDDSPVYYGVFASEVPDRSAAPSTGEVSAGSSDLRDKTDALARAVTEFYGQLSQAQQKAYDDQKQALDGLVKSSQEFLDGVGADSVADDAVRTGLQDAINAAKDALNLPGGSVAEQKAAVAKFGEHTSGINSATDAVKASQEQKAQAVAEAQAAAASSSGYSGGGTAYSGGGRASSSGGRVASGGGARGGGAASSGGGSSSSSGYGGGALAPAPSSTGSTNSGGPGWMNCVNRSLSGTVSYHASNGWTLADAQADAAARGATNCRVGGQW